MSVDKPLFDSLQSYFSDLRIRQMLTPEKASVPLLKGVFYVLPYETRAEPGFLCCFKGTGATWISGRLDQAVPLRMRLSSSLFEKGTVLIATLDRQNESVSLEDVWLWKGENLRKRPFSERYKKLKPFWDEHFIQDKRLSGLDVSIAYPLSLQQLKEKVDSLAFQGVDLIPEQGDRRRFFIPLGKLRAQGRSKQQAPTQPMFVETDDVEQQIEASASKEHPTWCYAKKVVGMPDTYDLLLADGKSLGSAAVQSFALSQSLRQAFGNQKMVAVSVAWHSDFLCYEILGLHQNGKR
jgi:hypothetical protein